MISELVSIIIPVYKAEKDIEQCLHSIGEQTYSNLEVILVDDGSPDRCPEICDAWARKDARIHVIHQKNAGVSAARNAGMEAMNGKWVVFLDADDRMDSAAIENALKLAKETACDTVCWNCYKECDGSISKYPAIKPDNRIYQGKKMLGVLIESLYQTREELFYPGHMFRAVWGKALSADIIRKHGITFPVGQPLGEDAAFLVDYFQACNKVLLVNEYWNYYKISTSSAVRQYRSDLKELQISELKLLCEKIHLEEVDMDTVRLNQYLLFDYQYIHHLCQKEKNFFSIYKKMKSYIKDRNYPWKHSGSYNMKKVHKQSIPVAWSMIHGFVCLETLLCMLRERRHSGKKG